MLGKTFVIGLSVLSYFISSAALAGDRDLKTLPPLTPITLLVARSNPGLHILLTNENSDEARGLVLLMNDGGTVTSPEYDPRRTTAFYDGGSYEINFGSGERLIVPTIQQKENYLQTHLGPTLMSPNHAPIMFARKTITPETLEALGFAPYLASASENPVREYEKEKEPPFENPKVIRFVRILLKEKVRYTVQDEIEKQISAMDSQAVRALKSNSIFGSGGLYALVRVSSINALKRQLAPFRSYIAAIDVINPAQDFAQTTSIQTPGKIRHAIDLLNKTNEPLIKRTILLKGLATTPNLDRLSEATKIELTTAIVTTLTELIQTESQISRWLQYVVAVQDLSKLQPGSSPSVGVGSEINFVHTEMDPARPVFLDGIRQSATDAFIVLDHLNTRLAHQTILQFSESAAITVLPVISGDATGTGKSYFQVWLDEHVRAMDLVNRLPTPPRPDAFEKAQLGLQRHSGGIFKNFRFSGEFYHLLDYEKRPIYPLQDSIPTALLALLGSKKKASEREQMKRAVIQTIIDMDRRAERLIAWQNNNKQYRDQSYESEDTDDVSGSEQIRLFLMRLVYGAQTFVPLAMGDDFSMPLYQKSILDIQSQLLEIADVSIRTQGTYISLLDSALEMVKKIENDKGLTARNDFGVGRRAVTLQSIVQKRLYSARTWAEDRARIRKSNSPTVLLGDRAGLLANSVRTCESLFGSVSNK